MKVKNISKSYGTTKVLNDISVEFEENGLVFLMGKSGAGKTTLFNVLSGIDSEYEGNIDYECGEAGRDLSWYRKNVLGIIFQDFNLLEHLNVRENIALGAKISGKSYKEEDYKEIIRLLDIEALEDRHIGTLSGGERQRVAIARALLRDDRIIFADEPSGSLDEGNTKNLFDYIKKLSINRLFIVITHDSSLTEEYGDRIIEIKDGKIVEDRHLISNCEKKAAVNESESEQDLIANRKQSWIEKYCLKSFMARKKKTVGVIAISTLAVLCVLFILGFVSAISNIFTELNTEILENDRYIIQNRGENSHDNIISEEDISFIEDIKEVKYINAYYKDMVYIGDVKLRYDVIGDVKFYKDRFKNIEGRIPEKSEEILIDKNLAQKIFDGEDCIGKTVEVNIDGSAIKEMTVVGVKNLSGSEDGEIYVTKEFSDYVYSVRASSYITLCKENDDEENAFDSYILKEQNLSLLAGRMPENEQEIVVSEYLVNSLLSTLYDSAAVYSVSDIRNGEIEDIINEKLLGAEVALHIFYSNTNIGHYTVVGIATEETGDIEAPIYVAEEFESAVKFNYCDVYLDNIEENITENFERVLRDKDYSVERFSQGKSQVVQGKTSLVIAVITLITIIVILMTAVVIRYFVKMNVKERQYEIGVLMAMGNTRKNIVRILIEEQGIISLVVMGIITLVFAIVKMFDISGMIQVDNVAICDVKGWHLLCGYAMCLILVVLFAIPTIISSSKKNIVNLLRNSLF